jgi:hypothetical protein
MTEFPTAEQPHLDAHAAGAEGLLALHGGKDRLTRIFLRPHTAEAGRGQQRGIQAGSFFPAQAHLRRGVGEPVRTEEVRFRIWDSCVVRVARTNAPNLYGL